MSTICSWYNDSTTEKKKITVAKPNNSLLLKSKMNCTNPYRRKLYKLPSIIHVTKQLLFLHSFQISVIILFNKLQTQSKE